MKHSTDEQIQIWAKRISRDDRKAFDELFRKLYPRLVPFACRYTRSTAVARDLVQDAFVALWQHRKEIDPNRSLKAYLYRIVRNKALNHLRDHSVETIGVEPADEHQLKSNDQEEEHSKDTFQENSGVLMDHLRQWIGELPERRREAFELSRFEGLDHEEIAGVMDVSVNTVNNHIVSALKFLKERYELYEDKLNMKKHDE